MPYAERRGIETADKHEHTLGSILNSSVNQALSYLPRKLFTRVGGALRALLFLLFDYLLPKTPNTWCFCTWNNTYPHTIDNPRGLFEEVKNDSAIRKVILLKPYHKIDRSIGEGVNVLFVDVESMKGAYLLARSRVIVLGYGLTGLCSYAHFITSRHKIIQLWHGIPLKRIGKLFPGEHFWHDETPKYAATICSSREDQHIMAAAFAPTANVWITGLPRNDLILKPERELPSDYRTQLAQLRNRISGRRFVLYAPTWRNDNSGIYPFSERERTILRDFLFTHNAAMGIRAHANRRPGDDPLGDQPPQSIFFVNEIPDANLVLRMTDVLITDYSSIYIDFLLTGRPILNFTYDIDSYVEERGFLYPLDDAMPNKPFRTFDELLIRLQSALNGDEIDVTRYKKATSLFHDHPEQSSKQVMRHIEALAVD